MDYGELTTRWTVRIALLCYALVLAGILRGDLESRRGGILLRYVWSFGCVTMLIHVACAFHFFHHWSQRDAYDHTAQTTNDVVGMNWGGGIYLNYLFTAIWAADASYWWYGLEGYRLRARALTIALHSFFVFMIFNATVVFETGATRWVAATLCVILILLWISSRNAKTRTPAL